MAIAFFGYLEGASASLAPRYSGLRPYPDSICLIHYSTILTKAETGPIESQSYGWQDLKVDANTQAFNGSAGSSYVRAKL